jgi:hypothetical protein
MFEKKKITLFGEQPTAKISEKTLKRLIKRDFPNQAEIIYSKLIGIKGDSLNGKRRIAASILKLANKDLDEIEQLINKANEDYRDVLAKSEYPRNSSYDFGERTEKENKKDYIQDWEEYSDWLNQ